MPGTKSSSFNNINIEIRMPGLEPISFAPKANALPIELHPEKEGVRETLTAGIEPCDLFLFRKTL